MAGNLIKLEMLSPSHGGRQYYTNLNLNCSNREKKKSLFLINSPRQYTPSYSVVLVSTTLDYTVN